MCPVRIELKTHELNIVKARLASTSHAQMHAEIESLRAQVYMNYIYSCLFSIDFLFISKWLILLKSHINTILNFREVPCRFIKLNRLSKAMFCNVDSWAEVSSRERKTDAPTNGRASDGAGEQGARHQGTPGEVSARYFKKFAHRHTDGFHNSQKRHGCIELPVY